MKNKDFNRLCGVDEFGRTISPVTGRDNSKQVGLFYFLWNGQHDCRIHNIDKMLESDTKTVFCTEELPEIHYYDFHYWGEPLFGYYKGEDEYVVRKHCEMLTAAGVDYICFDTTNAVIYPHVAYVVMKVWKEYQDKGWDVPKIIFYTNNSLGETASGIYDIFYAKYPEFDSLWYRPNGKPVIIVRYTDKSEFDSQPVLRDFFDIWRAQWPNEPYFENGIPWMEWVFPQPRHGDFINVSVAQHHRGWFSSAEGNWGRGTDMDGVEHHDDYRLGQNFQRQWDVALASKAHNIFVTGWNEWGAMKILHEGHIVYVDCFDEEYSRDTEPMKDGYHDAFYQQMIRNIRRFKMSDGLTASRKKTIDITKGAEQWDDAETYYAFGEDNFIRNFASIDPNIVYTTDPADNNIQSVSVAHDDDNLYFMIRTERDIVPYNDKPGYMNLLIGVGEPKKQGWEGYNFVVNRRMVGSCDRMNMSGNTITYNTVNTVIDGNTMKIEIPRALIGADNAKQIYFKVADSVSEIKNIDNYYVTGKVLPLGRLSYAYAL